MNIWTVDKATIEAEIRQRNALRKSALLPLLDEQRELGPCVLAHQKQALARLQGEQAIRL